MSVRISHNDRYANQSSAKRCETLMPRHKRRQDIRDSHKTHAHNMHIVYVQTDKDVGMRVWRVCTFEFGHRVSGKEEAVGEKETCVSRASSSRRESSDRISRYLAARRCSSTTATSYTKFCRPRLPRSSSTRPVSRRNMSISQHVNSKPIKRKSAFMQGLYYLRSGPRIIKPQQATTRLHAAIR